MYFIYNNLIFIYKLNNNKSYKNIFIIYKNIFDNIYSLINISSDIDYIYTLLFTFFFTLFKKFNIYYNISFL